MKMRLAAALLCVALPGLAFAQTRVIGVRSTDGLPVEYANVVIEGGATQITDEKGEVAIGAGKAQTLTVSVRRIGFAPWFGKMALPDTAAVLTVTLSRVAQSLSAVRVTGDRANRVGLKLQGFYDRWLLRQKGVLTATFIGPEEIEFQHPGRITNMLYGLHGVNLVRFGHGDLAAFSTSAGSMQMEMCPMAIVIDGVQQQPDPPTHRGGVAFVNIDRILNANDVAAIEVYARVGNMPVSLQVDDSKCGVIAFWTGSRNQ